MQPQVIEWRRYFHKNPELSNHEKETSQIIANHLRSLNLEVQTGINGYGVTGYLQGDKPGPTIAFRADMDALPIQDEKTCDYRSTVPGVMHACGHDAHSAILMGAATLLQKMRHQLQGNILFIFQPAEELPPGGALGMIEQGVLSSVDAIYGLHLWSPLPVGKIGCFETKALAASDGFEIVIKGKGGHGGMPHETIDSVLIASQLIVNLQTIVSRHLDPLSTGVVSIGEIHGGSSFNVIADQCTITGTTRSFETDIRQTLLRKIEQITATTCQMYGASYKLNIINGYPPLINHKEHSDIVMKVAKGIVGMDHAYHISPLMVGEDFAYYLEKKPGAFFFVGAGNTTQNIIAPHHHPAFDVDETAMMIGLECWIELALKHLFTLEKSENFSTVDWRS